MSRGDLLLTPRARAGFSLPETLLAAAVVATVLLAVTRMLPTASQRITTGGNMTRASALAQALMEMIRGEAHFADVLAYDGLDTGRGETLPAACLPSGAPGCINSLEAAGEGKLDRWQRGVEQLGAGRGSVTISPPPAAPGVPRLAVVTVTISWADSLGSGTARIVTAIAERL